MVSPATSRPTPTGAGKRLLHRREVNGNPLQLTHGSARNSERRESTSGTVGIGCSTHFRTSPAPQALTPAAF